MGIYLAKPNTETDSHDITSEKFNSGYSSMQGWRSAQEDAHNMIVDFLENISLFGVYDGHGGPEVAQYVSQHFPNFLRERYAKKSNEESLETFLQSSFLAFDARLKEPSTLAELRKLNREEDEESNYNELISSNNNSACGLKRNNKLRKQKITSTTTNALKEGAGDSDQESDEQHQMINGEAFGHQEGDEMPTSSSTLMNGSIDSDISFEIHEASLLRQEANMPIDEILANNYEGVENVKDDKTVITSVLSEETRNLLLGPDQQHSQQKDNTGNINSVNNHPHHVDDRIKKVCTFTSTQKNCNKVDMRKEKAASSKSGTGAGRNPNSLAEFYNADMNQNDDSEDDSDFQVDDLVDTSQDEDEEESSEEQTNDENESSEADELNEESDEETNKKSQQNASSPTFDQNEFVEKNDDNKNHSSKDLTSPDKMVLNKSSEKLTTKPDSTTHINSSKNESLHDNLESPICSEITSSTNKNVNIINNYNTQINNVSTSENGLSTSPKNKIEGIHREESILRRKVVKGAKETSPQKDTPSYTDLKVLPEFPTSLLNDDDEHIETTSTTDVNGNISTTSKDSTNTTNAAGKRKHSTTLENDSKIGKNNEIKEECNSSSSNNSRIDDNNFEKQKSPSKSLTGTLSSPLHKKLKEETTATIHMNGDIKHEQDIPVDSSSNCDSSDNSNAIISIKNKQNGEIDSAEENADDHIESESESGDVADDYEDTDENGDDDEDDDDLDPRQAIFEEYLNAPKGKPGYDSGCTAVLAWLDTSNENCPDLYVANIGDSRCVVSNKGTAVDMSFDHKPEDEPEKERIEGAGGVVTEDGRVNEGLNLSRAFGDHHYKMEKSLDATKQMIIALPDVKHCKITPNSDFIVLACDGIWNSMSSQQVIDFVEERKEEYYDCPSKICEQLFHECLAPGTGGDGTGCDNMTCIIIFPKKSNSTTSQ